MKKNPLLRFLKWIWPKPKKRVNVIEAKVKDITKDLLISGFSDTEIAIIANTVKSDIKNALQDRKLLLTKALEETTEAINKL